MTRASCAPVGPKSLSCLCRVLCPAAMASAGGACRAEPLGTLARGWQPHTDCSELTGLLGEASPKRNKWGTRCWQLFPQTQPWNPFSSLRAVMPPGLLHWEPGDFLGVWREETGFSSPHMLLRSNQATSSPPLHLSETLVL